MPIVHTIGYTRKSLERFIRLLQEAGVDAVIDVRLRNTSQLAGFSKRDDLAFLLRQGFSIEYEHRPDLAPTPEIRDAYRDDGDWPAYEVAFNELLVQRQATEIGRDLLAKYERPCLLCAEPTPERCHRRLVAEWWAGRLPGVEVKHL
ncbi:MAG: DUF488 family protein [Anaerolineae bacterium]|jgi:uncharacterized protein (DUF488 family)